MAFDVAGARTSGYSDAEIADFLSGESKFDAAAARQAGYSDSEIISHLSAGAKQSTVLGELKRGFKQLVSSTQTGIGALTEPEAAAKAGMERAQKISEEAGEGVSFAPVKEAYEKRGILSALGEAASQVPRAVAGMAPAAAATIAGTKAGALAGAAAAPVLGPFAPVGPIVGGLLGAGTALYGSMAGSNIERQAQEQAEAGKPISIDRPAAYGAAVGQTALEAVGTGAVLGKRLVKGVLGIADDAALATAQARQALIKEAERSALGATARGAARGATEIPVEIAQSVLERAQAGLDVMSPEAFNEYGETAYQAGIGGGGVGALTGLPSRAQARAELQATQPAGTADAARQEAQQRILSARAAPRGFTEEGQGKLFASEELEGLAKPEEEAPVAAAPEAPAPVSEAPQPEQLGLGFPTAESPEAAQQELDLLKKQKTPEAKDRAEELKGFIRAAEEQAKAEAPKGYTPEGQGRLFTPTEMRESGLKREREPAPETEAAPLTPGQLKRQGQGAFKFEAPKAEAPKAEAPKAEAPKAEAPKAEAPKAEAGTTGIAQIEQGELTPLAPVTEPVPEPTLAPKRVVPPELQPVIDSLTAAGVRPETKTWAENGRNRPFLRKLVSMSVMAPEARQAARKALKLEEGSHKAEAFDALFPAPRVPAFEPAAGAGKPSVGIPSKPRPVAPTAAGAGETVRRGVVPVRRTPPTPAAPEGGAKPALKEPTPKKVSLKEAEAAWEDNNVEGAGTRMAFKDLSSDRKKMWKDAVEDGTATIEEYERFAKDQADIAKAEKRKAAADAETQRATEEAEAAEKKAQVAAQIRDREQAKRDKAEAKRKEEERVKAEREAEAKAKAEAAAARERAKRETEAEAKRKEEERIKAEQKAEAKAKAEAEEVPPYEERVQLGKDDLYPKLKDFDSAVSAVYEQASNPADREIASLIQARVAELKKLGFTFSLNVTPENQRLATGARGRSTITLSPIGSATDIAVTLNHPSNRDQSGTNWTTVAHELLHAVTQAQIHFSPEGSAAKKLESLFNDVVAYFNNRAKAGTLTEFETRIFKQEINALTDPDELLAWGLTDKNMREWLDGIESTKGNFLSRLFDVVADALGLRKTNTALAELLSVSETILTEPLDVYVTKANLRGKSFGLQENVSNVPGWALSRADGRPVVWSEADAALVQTKTKAGDTMYLLATPDGISRVDVSGFTGKLLSPERLAEVQAVADTLRAAPEEKTRFLKAAPSPTEGIAETSELMKEAPGEFKTAVKDFTRIFTEKDDVSYVTRFRTEIADSKASAVNRMNILFDGGVRDELTGINNPERLIRQAEDPSALFTAFMSTGGLEKDPTSGRYVATDKAGPGGSIADMLAAVKNWSDANGMDFNLAYAETSKLIEARRLDNMRQANEQIKEAAKKAGVKAELFPIHKLSQKDERTADEQIDAALRGLKANPEIQAIADMMDKQRAYMIDHMVAVGRISKETAQEWKDAAGYVPFDRVEDFFNKYVPRRTTGRGITQLGSLPKFVGSTEREVGNVLNNHVKLMGWMLTQTLKQDAGSTTLNLLADIGQARRLHGDKLAANNAGNVVRSYKNGREEFFEMRSRYDVKAFLDAPEPKLAIIKLFAQVSNILRKIVTVMPPFIAKQVTDDIQRGFLTSGVKSPSRLIIPAVTNFLRIAGHEVVFGKDHPFTKEFAKKGLGGNIDYNANNPAETVLFSLGYSKRGWLNELHHRLESITRASDLAMRKAIYDRTMVEENKDVALATARAQEFINFRRRGASTTINLGVATIPFFNAYLQANDLLLRSMVGRGSSTTEKAVARRLFWTQAAKMTGFALIYSLANSDDEEYKDQTLADRSNNWIIGGKELPVPGDMAALFKVPVEVLVQYMARQGTKDEQLTSEAVKQVLGYAYEQFVGRVTPVPQAIRPVAEALMNHSLLTGRELVGTYQQGMPKPLQTTTTTSELAKAIAIFAFNNIKDPVTDTPLQLSPIVIDNTLRGYLGGAVPLMNMLIDQLLNPNKTDRPLSKYWFLSQYLTPEVPTGPTEEFYDLVNKVMPAKRALAQLEKTDMPAAMAYYEKNKDNLLMAELVNKALQDIEQSRAYIKYLDSAEGAKAIESSAERLKMKQEVERYKNENLKWVRSAKAQIFGKKE